ncbi:MAG TPA: hypothetical protein VLH38_05240 [Patescibacteria group bacterium]|nr:hypothetical protein [Patescibacteria group bacterium]
MFRRKTPVEAPPNVSGIDPQFTPHEIVQAYQASAKTTKRKGIPPARLPKRSYRQLSEFAVDESTIRVASLGEAPAALGLETTERFFRLATHIGRAGVFDMLHFHIADELYHPIQVALEAPARDGILAYGPADIFNLASSEGAIASSYTIASGRLNDGIAVSFVGVPPSGATLESKMAASTEIFQNRMRVVGVASGTANKEYAPLQESLANGLGNVLGHVAGGNTYRSYKEYVLSTYRWHSAWAHELPEGGGIAVAPHLLAAKSLYEQIADNALPQVGDLQFTPVLPRR